MRKYVVLRVKKLMKQNFHYLGARSFVDATEFPIISMEFIPEKEINDVKDDPAVQAIAPVMPTSLIRPVDFKKSNISEVWGVSAVRANHSHYTGEGVRIAVLDTGIDKAHPAFSGVQFIENDFSGDGNGDRIGHGTHCAGTIFGRDFNGQRIGIARGVTDVWIGKVLGDDGNGQSEMIFKALYWTLEQKIDIISMSLGFDFTGMVNKMVDDGWPLDLSTSIALEAYGSNLRMFDAIMSLLKFQAAFGISPLVVAAAGNESRRDINKIYRIATSLPAAAVDVISVAAIQRTRGKYSIANFSNTLATVVGPGVNITSAWPGGGLHTLSGTSMACPHVAGVAALWCDYLKKEGFNSTAKNITSRLLVNARRDNFVDGTTISDIGQGIITAP